MAAVFGSFDISTQSAFDPEQVVATFAPYLRIAHQISGRIRFKLATAALKGQSLREADPERLRVALATIRGVHNIQFNLLARSCVVEYDNQTIPDVAWPELLSGRDTPAAGILFAILREKYEEIRHGQL